MKQIDFCQFTLVEAASRSTVLTFSVMLDNTVRINGKLTGKLQSNYINIWSGPDGTIILLKPVTAEEPKACRISKDGKAYVPKLLEILEALDVKLPAKYFVEWNESEGKWQGELNSKFEFPMKLPKHANSAPRKRRAKAADS